MDSRKDFSIEYVHIYTNQSFNREHQKSVLLLKQQQKKVGAKFVFAKDQGHMGSNTFSQPYREFPLLKDH